MAGDDQRNPAPEVLDKEAFLYEVEEIHRKMPSRLRRGCLLVLRFPVIKSLPAGKISDTSEHDVADDALRHLQAIIATRVRARDTLGRISRYSLCILLRGCKQSDAAVVADQYAALLHDVVLQAGERHVPIDMRYRVVALDSDKDKSGRGSFRMLAAPPMLGNTQLSKQIKVGGNTVDLSSSKVVSLNSVRLNNQASISKLATNSEATAFGSVLSVGVSDSAQSWRLKPGITLKRTSMICCYKLQPLGVVGAYGDLQDSDLFFSVLNALALRADKNRPHIESQLIVPVQVCQLDSALAEWVISQCDDWRIAKSDICLSLSVTSMSKDLPRIAPVLRQLNRKGIRLMLEGIDSSSQLLMMKNVAHFDYLYLSGRALNDSVSTVYARSNLESIIAQAQEQYCEICAGGIDSQAALAHAASLGIEIGFGRHCGATSPFPSAAWYPAEQFRR